MMACYKVSVYVVYNARKSVKMIDFNKSGKLIGRGLDAEVNEYDGDKIIKTFTSKNKSLIEFYRYCHQNPHPNLPVIHEIFEGDSFGYVGEKY